LIRINSVPKGIIGSLSLTTPPSTPFILKLQIEGRSLIRNRLSCREQPVPAVLAVWLIFVYTL
jgi:hypothetical protein